MVCYSVVSDQGLLSFLSCSVLVFADVAVCVLLFVAFGLLLSVLKCKQESKTMPHGAHKSLNRNGLVAVVG